MPREYELTDDSVVVVIGSGAGGGTLANELAQKGIDVVCLEAGGRLTFADIENDPGLMNERMDGTIHGSVRAFGSARPLAVRRCVGAASRHGYKSTSSSRGGPTAYWMTRR